MPRTQTKPTQKTPPVTPAPDQIPATAATPERKRNAVQDTLCEIASDLIFNGGHTDDVANFLESLACHEARREYPDFDHTQRVKNHTARWTRELGRLVPELPVGVAHAKPAPSSPSDGVRMNLRYRVARELDEFVRGANFEELYFMKEVLELRGSNNGGAEDELPLAFACSVELDRAEQYYYVVPEALDKAFNHFRHAVEGETRKKEAD